MINKYEFGRISIDGKDYYEDLIVFPYKIVENWRRKKGHEVCLEDLKEVLKYRPELLIIGTGHDDLVKVEKEVADLFTVLIVVDTARACNIYNSICDNKTTVLALHLTC